MDRKATARKRSDSGTGILSVWRPEISIEEAHRKSVKGSVLITPGGGDPAAEGVCPKTAIAQETRRAVAPWRYSTVEASLEVVPEGKKDIAILNFASAKNPGGGFLNGAMAQEETWAASAGFTRR